MIRPSARPRLHPLEDRTAPATAGSLDPTFGSGGVAAVPFGPYGTVSAVAVQPDGRIMAAGFAETNQLMALRLPADGTRDPSFGTKGLVVKPVVGPEGANDTAIQPDGKIIVVGPNQGDAVVARLLGATGPLPPGSLPGQPVLVGGAADGTARLLSPSGGGYLAGQPVLFFPGFTGEVRTATADVTGDGVPDLVGGAGPGGGPRVVVIDGKTGTRVADFLAFEAGFTGGVFATAADLDGDGKAEVLATPDRGGGPGGAPRSGSSAANRAPSGRRVRHPRPDRRRGPVGQLLGRWRLPPGRGPVGPAGRRRGRPGRPDHR